MYLEVRRLSRKLVVASLFCLVYCWVTMPSGAPFLFYLIEAVAVSLMGIGLWSSCSFAVKYKFVLALVLICVFIGLGLSLAGAAACSCMPTFVNALGVKAFCLCLAYSVLALASILKSKDIAEQSVEPVVTSACVEKIHSVTVKTGNDIKIIDTDSIILLKAEGDYVSIVTQKGRYLKEQTMKYFAESLPCEVFIRIHRSYIINTKFLQSIEKYGDYQMVLMSNGEKIRISATGYKLLKEKLGL